MLTLNGAPGLRIDFSFSLSLFLCFAVRECLYENSKKLFQNTGGRNGFKVVKWGALCCTSLCEVRTSTWV
ncbi:MAG: hypothetical protein ACI9HK_004172 [Pirellulaceae bacterium]|jgi:hypothetical protein